MTNRRRILCRRPNGTPRRRLFLEPLEDRSLLACDLIVTNTLNSGAGSLREAINCANSNGLDDTIIVPAGQYNLSGTANEDANAGGDLDLKEVNHSLTIHGAGANQTIISAGGIDRVLQVFANVTAVLESLSITGGSATIGGGILNAGNLTLNDAAVYSNAATTGGGLQTSGPLTLNRSNVHDNVASSASTAPQGGGIYASVGTGRSVIVADSTIEKNTVTFSGTASVQAAGGGISCSSSQMTVLRSIIRENSVINSGTGSSSELAVGGGIYTNLATVQITSSEVSKNRVAVTSSGGGAAHSKGGGIFAGSSSLMIEAQSSIVENAVFSSSTTTGSINAIGGGLNFSAGGTQLLAITDSEVSRNTIDSTTNAGGINAAGGGGIDITSGTVQIARTTIDANRVTGPRGAFAGGIGVSGPPERPMSMSLTRVLVSNNLLESPQTPSGAGILAATNVIANILQSTIRDNRITGAGMGGGINFSGGQLTITESTVSGNAINSPTSGTGGGIRALSALTLINSTISGNTVTGAAGFTSTSGGISTSTQPVLIRDSTITGNRVVQGTTGGLDATSTSGDTLTVTMHNTIVAGNFAGADGTTPSDIVGLVNVGTAQSPSSFNNLIGDAATSGGLTNGINGNLVGNHGSGTFDINQVLNPTLADHGGPTLTHALALNSSAIDGGIVAQSVDASGQQLTTDQRGFSRFLGKDVDIGAYELTGPPCSLIVTNTSDSGSGSLRQAIICANLNPGAAIISFNIPGTGVHTISPLTALPTITEAVTIDGYKQPGAVANTNAIDDADPAKRGFNGSLLIELNGTSAGAASGLRITGSGSTIRGVIINGFTNSGISVEGGDNNTIAGNLIGTDPTGMAAAGNGRWGVVLFSGSSGNTVGTNGDGASDPAERNVISASGWGGVGISGAGSDDNIVAGNLIGTDSAGTTALGNVNRGVDVCTGAAGNRIGTNADAVSDGAERNLISGNLWDGVGLCNAGTSHNIVAGNWIGVDISGELSVLNAKSGVILFGGATDNTIGGTAAAAGNIIAFNAFDGVGLLDAATIENSIIGNSIYANSDLGIDLGPAGLTPNDNSDADTGPNNRQNFPEIRHVTRSGGKPKVTYSVPSATANSTYPIRVEFFQADAKGQGQTYLGFDTFTEADFQAGEKTVTLDAVAPAVSERIVGTATDSLATGGPANTSEFSAIAVIASPGLNPAYRLNNAERYDVTDDDHVVADDVIAVINYINAQGSGKIPDDAANAKPYCDVNGDNNVAADDVIAVINYINAGLAGEGEAEGAQERLASPVSAAVDDVMTLWAMEGAERGTRRKR